MLVSLAQIRQAANRVRGVARITPLIPISSTADWSHLWIKCENLQVFGAFKVRGAYNFLAALDPDVRARGVITYSSGNHGQAVAYAARQLGTSSPQRRIPLRSAYVELVRRPLPASADLDADPRFC